MGRHRKGSAFLLSLIIHWALESRPGGDQAINSLIHGPARPVTQLFLLRIARRTRTLVGTTVIGRAGASHRSELQVLIVQSPRCRPDSQRATCRFSRSRDIDFTGPQFEFIEKGGLLILLIKSMGLLSEGDLILGMRDE